MDALKQHLEEVVNKTWNFSGMLKTNRDHELNAVMGLAGEAGEVLDELKKECFHKHDHERRNHLRDELGDVFYYLIKVMDIYNFSVEEILAFNKTKLYKRHGIEEGNVYFD